MDKEKMAIERLKIASELSLNYYNQPLVICYSGGKDSDCLLEIARRSGVRYWVQHSHTTVDAPPTVQHIRRKFRQLELDGIKTIMNMPSLTMWQLIIKKGMPPTRLVRFCCSNLKETFGKNMHIVTGVRKSESTNRSKRSTYETIVSDVKKRVYLDDNDDRRRLTEHCLRKGTTTTNAIIDWQDSDVWDYLEDTKAEINPLYSCGFKRIGCIGCPMAGKCMRQAEFKMFPTYKRMYIRTFDKMLEVRKAKGLENNPNWENGESIFRWWMGDEFVAGQLNMFEQEAAEEQ